MNLIEGMFTRRSCVCIVLLSFLSVGNAFGNGEVSYNKLCASCHDKPTDPKIPHRLTMSSYYQSRVHDALTSGAMAPFVQGMDEQEIQEIVAFVTERVEDPDERTQLLLCEKEPISAVPVISQWGIDKANTRFQPNSSVNAANVASLKLKWVFNVPNSRTMRGYPAVSEDTIFLPNTTGKLYAISRETGCVKWHFDAEGEIRTAAHLFSLNDTPVVSFGSAGSTVVIVSALDGSLIYRENVALFSQSMLTGTQVQHGDSLYIPVSAIDVALAMNPRYECCTSHGGLHAVNLADWSIRWTAHTTENAKPTYKNPVGTQMHGPSGAPIWSSPTIDEKRNHVYIGTGENTSSPATNTSDAIMAFDLSTGEEKWVFQGTKGDAFNMACRRGPNCPLENGPDFDFGAAPILTTTSAGTDLVLAGQKSGDVWALNPDSGELVWNRKLSPGSALGGVHWGMTLVGDVLIVPIADPDFVEGKNPGVFALDTKTGEVIWSHKASRACELSGIRSFFSRTPRSDCPFHYAFSAAASSTNDVVFAGSLDGRVFAFRVTDGEVLWSFDTKQEFEGVNSGEALGGAVDNPGVAIAGNQVMVLSGYDLFGQVPGNVLLMFELAKTDTGEG